MKGGSLGSLLFLQNARLEPTLEEVPDMEIKERSLLIWEWPLSPYWGWTHRQST